MKRIILPLSLIAFTLGAQAQNEIKEKFNPVRTAVISQTIAADARGAAMGELMCIHKTGIRLSILSQFRVLVLR